MQEQKKYKIRTLQFKRKRKGLTNYLKRLDMLKSDNTRLVIRVGNNSISAQLVNYNPEGDKVLLTVCSTDLKRLGWLYNAGSLPANYLTGMLLAKKSKDAKLKLSKDIIVDFGIKKFKSKSKPYALIKGAIDNGLNVLCDAKMFPNDNRIKGEHIADFAAKASEINKFQFTKSKNVDKIVDLFNDLTAKLKT